VGWDTACSGNLVLPDVSILPCKRPYCSGKKCSVLQDCAYIIPFWAGGCLGERGGGRGGAGAIDSPDFTGIEKRTIAELCFYFVIRFEISLNMIIWIFFWWLLLEIVYLFKFSVIIDCSHHTCCVTTLNCDWNRLENTQSIFIPPSKFFDLPTVLPSWVVVNENCRITVIVSRGTKGYKVSSLAQLKIHIFTSLLWPSQSSM
jgi:hypothetical protein